ncbi:MAG: molybdopterin-dependent oxidoreductase, partial [Gammaproteobacteria bacterium]|nr:molybdopterin-dependent oxidoreductase [Gammaproteobacteria bacterium]
GIPNARNTLKAIKKDTGRTMVVIDPRRTETARQADVHLQLKPGTDAFLMAAMLSIIVQNGWYDRAFLEERTPGFETVLEQLATIDARDYAGRAGVDYDDVKRVAEGLARARTASVRVDLGTQHTLHTTLNAYLEKLLVLLTGNFGIEGGNTLHTSLIPLVGNTDERRTIEGKTLARSVHHKMMPIGGMYPPNILPDEIEHGGIRAMIVDSCNAAVSWPDSEALTPAFESLDLLVVVDVAMTETARLAHYVLPAASQFEKWEFTGFNLEFPDNYFHLRHPLFEPDADTLSEPEIYTPLLEAMGEIPGRFPLLENIPRFEPGFSRHGAYLAGLSATLKRNPAWRPYGASIMYRTLGRQLGNGAAAAAPLLPLAMRFAARYSRQVRRAGIDGGSLTQGVNLFRAILAERSGVVISRHTYEESWELIANEDRRIHLAIDEMLAELGELEGEQPPGADFPFILLAGERRSYNANQIYRDPKWRKIDPHGAMRLHPDDAAELGLAKGDRATCRSEVGSIEVVVDLDDSIRRGVVTLPHGYGMRYRDSDPGGPQINRLTGKAACDPLSKTPFHKYVPVHIERSAA